MEGYDERSYGRGMADVYDDWYAGVSDVDATVARLAALAEGGPVLELGVGTGRLALPLADRGLDVWGVDTSPDMLARLRAKPGGERVHTFEADMAAEVPPGPFRLVFAAYNTLFSLTSAAAQEACVAAAAARLTPGGRFVVEAFVPDTRPEAAPDVTVRDLTAERVVLAVSRVDPEGQTAHGQFVELTEAGGVRLRPWCVRWSTPEQLDAMAARAGLALEDRWEGWAAQPYGPDSPHHVSVWARKAA